MVVVSKVSPVMTRGQKIRAKVFLFFIGLFRRMTLGVRGVLINQNQVFLIRHTYVPGWQLPGGGVEAGESAQTSLAREIVEETGFRLTGPGQLFNVYLNDIVSDRDHVLVYKCLDFEQAFVFKPNREIAEAGWFDRRQLPPGTTAATRRRVEEIFDGVPAKDVW